jgi:hypothetical protein
LKIPRSYVGIIVRVTGENYPCRGIRLIPINLEKSVHPRKTQKARKYSKRYQAVDGYPKGEWLCNTTY